MAKKPAKDMPNLANATLGHCVDELGGIRVQAAELKTLDAYYSEAIEARLSPGQLAAEGDEFTMNKTASTQERLDTEKVREYLTSIGKLEEFTKVTPIVQKRFLRRPKPAGSMEVKEKPRAPQFLG